MLDHSRHGVKVGWNIQAGSSWDTFYGHSMWGEGIKAGVEDRKKLLQYRGGNLCFSSTIITTWRSWVLLRYITGACKGAPDPFCPMWEAHWKYWILGFSAFGVTLSVAPPQMRRGSKGSILTVSKCLLLLQWKHWECSLQLLPGV